MRILAAVGLISLLVSGLYVVKKWCGSHALRTLQTTGYYEDAGVYKAAEAFARGAPAETVEAMLDQSYEFDRRRIGQTLTLALPYRNSVDGGYRAFIQAVNQVLEEEVYR
ncbi:MAG: hypothetical protein K0R57_5531 [Paenibacillaceae bacterium]|jgi:hypothetical protein|nr:hypothetical protein [Paenibacillaceae bacterium]